MLQYLGTVLLVCATIPAVGVAWTWRRVDWRTSPLGRVLFGKSLAIATVLILSLISAVLLLLGWGRPWWFELLRLFAFGFVCVVLWAQWGAYRSIVLDATRRSRHDEDEDEHVG